MALVDLADWMNEAAKPGILWFVKRLAANDTLATHSHQAGPYMPKVLMFKMFPAINRPEQENPDHSFDLYLDSHADHRLVRAIWYNGKLHGKTRNETRLTRFGGSQSAILDPDSTGTIAVFAFTLRPDGTAEDCHAWVCRSGIEDDLVEERVGPVEPGEFVVRAPGTAPAGDLFAAGEARPRVGCRLQAFDIPPAWLGQFPSGEDIVRKTMALHPPAGMDADTRLTRRRECEYEIFQSVEEAFYLPRIRGGFTSVEGFLSLAQTILQSRKSRSGNSLEIHTREILTEEGLRSGTDFSHRPVIEGGKRPDFLFPSKAAYDDPAFPADCLRMLAAKTTCKDRWRQILNEASRIAVKHLLTLQEGVSEGQFREMSEAGVRLVVPADLHESYPKEVRPHLISFESFIGDARVLGLPAK